MSNPHTRLRSSERSAKKVKPKWAAKQRAERRRRDDQNLQRYHGEA